MLKQQPFSEIHFISDHHQLDLTFRQAAKDAVEVVFVLYPENNADSIQVKGSFGIDETYFPALLSGMNEMINWQN